MPQDEIHDPVREPIEDPVLDPDQGRVDAMSEASMEGSDPPAGWAGSDRAPSERTASALVEVWPRCSVCGNADATAFETLASSDDRAETLDGLQYSLDEGPCVDAAEGPEFFRSGEVATDPRWPRWGPRAAEAGVNSLLSVRLLVEGDPIGALNFYALYATHVAIALKASRQVSGLETALQSRHTIGMAQGILIERYGLSIDSSFDLLRRYSSTTNTKLSVVAEEIVRTGRLPRTDEVEGPTTSIEEPAP